MYGGIGDMGAKVVGIGEGLGTKRALERRGCWGVMARRGHQGVPPLAASLVAAGVVGGGLV